MKDFHSILNTISMTMKCQENQYEKPILNLDQSNHLLIICFDGNQNNERKFCLDCELNG